MSGKRHKVARQTVAPKRSTSGVVRMLREYPLPLFFSTLLLLGLIALIYFGYENQTANKSTGNTSINQMKCENEQIAVHYHASLTLIYNGQEVKVPAQIGFGQNCLYWMHTHDDRGVIHIEAPKEEASRQFTLGDFFDVWKQPLTSRQVATLQVPEGTQMAVFVDGKPYTGDPRKIVLKAHTQVVIEIGQPQVPPPTFQFHAGE